MSNTLTITCLNLPCFQWLLLTFLLLIVPSISQCPAATQYYLAANNQCYSTCPWQAPNNYYSYLPTNTCELICPGTYYGFDGNKSCVTTCPSTPTQTYYDTVNKRCVNVCPANYFGYLGSVTASNQKCVQCTYHINFSLPQPDICWFLVRTMRNLVSCLHLLHEWRQPQMYDSVS